MISYIYRLHFIDLAIYSEFIYPSLLQIDGHHIPVITPDFEDAIEIKDIQTLKNALHTTNVITPTGLNEVYEVLNNTSSDHIQLEWKKE